MVHEFWVSVWPLWNFDLCCQELDLKVLMPTWAHDRHVQSHPCIWFKMTLYGERTSLQSIARLTGTLRARMLRLQSKHGHEVVIWYWYNDAMQCFSPTVY